MRHAVLTTAACLLATTAQGACGQGAGPVAHFGAWAIGKTKLKDATGRCEPTTFANGKAGVYCFGQPQATIAEQRATVDLYFATNTPEAPLIELQLTISACKPEPVQGWLRTTLGQPKTMRGSRLTWEGDAVLAIAEVPNDAGKCKLRFFPPSERVEFDRLATPTP